MNKQLKIIIKAIGLTAAIFLGSWLLQSCQQKKVGADGYYIYYLLKCLAIQFKIKMR